MKVRTLISVLILVLVGIVGVSYTLVSLRKAAAPPEPSRSPSLAEAPVRLYGRVEPLGREVFVGPLQPRRVSQIIVREGQSVKSGQVLLELESDVERQDVQVAKERVMELERRLDMILDELRRKEQLFPSGAISEVDYSQKTLEQKFLRQQIATAKAEVERRERELARLTLRAPVDGQVYKFDVRLGELLAPQDYQRIVLGKREKQIRIFVESFWLDKVHVGDRFTVRDGETLRDIGEGTVIDISEYVGARDFRTEDSLERLDTKYAQAILQMEGNTDIPLGKLVLCERKLMRQ
jgi:multidrug efflux pump subunit AcrA (membrane-fusion protein)